MPAKTTKQKQQQRPKQTPYNKYWQEQARWSAAQRKAFPPSRRKKAGSRVIFKRKLFSKAGTKIRPFYVGYGAFQNLLLNILAKRAKQRKAAVKTNITQLKAVKPKTTTGAAARTRRGLTERGALAAKQVQLYKTKGWIKIARGLTPTGRMGKFNVNIVTGRRWRGPPGPLGDDVIVEILPTVELAIEAGRPGTLKSVGVSNVDWNLLWASINDFYLGVVKWCKDHIGTPHPRTEGMVPTDTGTLRRKMWQSLERQWYSKTKMPATPSKMKKAAEAGEPLLIIVLNTGKLMYAKPVNQMPTSMVAHPHGNMYRSGRGGLLWDPTAINNWYNAILLGGRQQAHSLTAPLRAVGKKLLEIHYS